MKIKCAIFDFDGTLFDSMYVWDSAGEDYLRSLGKEPGPNVREDMRTMSLAQCAAYFKREYALPFSEEEIAEGINRTVEKHYFYDVLPKPGATAFLEELRKSGVGMCVATATDRYQVEAALKRCGLDRYFDAVFTCSEVGAGKDRPDIFRAAAAHFGADRQSAVVFEDALHAVRTARADGFPVAAVYDPSERNQEEIRRLADVYIPDYAHTEAFLAFARGAEQGQKRCVIVGGADIRGASFLRKLLREDDFVVYCDGGLRHRDALGAAPDLIVGDFDSAENPRLPVETIVLPREKDDTDTYYAAKEGVKRGFNEFLLLGVTGGRLDHTLGNVSILLYLESLGKTARIADDLSDMEIVSREPVRIGGEYAFFSLMSVAGPARGITIRGAKYPLENGEITPEYQYGISNEVLPGKTAEVNVRDGRLLLVKVRPRDA